MNTGGPAFPFVKKWINDPPDKNDPRSYFGVCEVEAGMTLRDYFAAKAMQAFISKPGTINGRSNIEDFEYAQFAYRLADCMIAERDVYRHELQSKT